MFKIQLCLIIWNCPKRSLTSYRTVLAMLVVLISAAPLIIGCRSFPDTSEQLVSLFPIVDELPNWNGLEPGVSTEADTISYIETSNLKGVTHNQGNKSQQYYWYDKETKKFIEIRVSDGKVKYIEFNLSDAIPIIGIINSLGEPDWYNVEYRDFEKPSIGVNILFETHGVVISSFPMLSVIKENQFSQCNLDLSRVKIDRIVLAEKSSLKEIVAAKYSVYDEFSEWRGLEKVTVLGCE